MSHGNFFAKCIFHGWNYAASRWSCSLLSPLPPPPLGEGKHGLNPKRKPNWAGTSRASKGCAKGVSFFVCLLPNRYQAITSTSAVPLAVHSTTSQKSNKDMVTSCLRPPRGPLLSHPWVMMPDVILDPKVSARRHTWFGKSWIWLICQHSLFPHGSQRFFVFCSLLGFIQPPLFFCSLQGETHTMS